jgi:hypothetical protein
MIGHWNVNGWNRFQWHILYKRKSWKSVNGRKVGRDTHGLWRFHKVTFVTYEEKVGMLRILHTIWLLLLIEAVVKVSTLIGETAFGINISYRKCGAKMAQGPTWNILFWKNLNPLGEEYELWSSSPCSFLCYPVTSFLLGVKVFLSIKPNKLTQG